MSYPPQEPDQPPSPYEPPPGQHGPSQSQGQYGPPSGQEQYGQYGPPPGYGQYGPSGQGRGTNVLAVLSLVFAFVFAPAGIVLGHVAKRQIQRTGEEGDQLATWGLILSYVFTVVGLVACCGWIGLAIWGRSMDGSSYN
ncbi:hypothetical protein MCAG_03478 [Micromonospora sp. ATCC 39149]|uniref:DUF4190 domain-containing protein n=1 Tax=Micromonospora carbonacea TaxID=47853 RepID=A0A7D6CE98_9ACTN|nr:DUF4190 domain-containing protein [Micromonospora sp. ATCC 39149]EEP73151.1 hypothetical protein MCAG_03478 [Micromonospora sp. ATCC 39149]QLJ99189.1 DUF4190 domain-containing protein [Micromonospora carbonacea]